MEKSYPYTLIPRYPGAREYPYYVGVWKERLKVNKVVCISMVCMVIKLSLKITLHVKRLSLWPELRV